MEDMTKHDILSKVTERIVHTFHPIKIILFGSYARGEEKLDSDIDLLVILEKVINKRKDAVKIRRILSDLEISKDILVTTPEEIKEKGNLVGTILKPALEEGLVIYERK